jgi:DNA-binding NarL/FixJ family response regulator
MKIKIMLVDDHAVVAKGLRMFLSTQREFEIVGEARNGQEALDQIDELSPDIILMDLMMPVMNGIEATRRIKERSPGTKVIVLTSFSDRDHVVPALRAGAVGYFLKDVDPDPLAEAIRGAYRGNIQLHPEVAAHLMEGGLQSPSPSNDAASPKAEGSIAHGLTSREKEVLVLIAQGMSNKEIAAVLTITEKTVKTHVSNILSKLGMADRTQAALYAVKHGIGG